MDPIQKTIIRCEAELEARGPEAVLDAGSRALALLSPLENWPGIARAHSAAYEKQGDEAAALAEWKRQVAAAARLGES